MATWITHLMIADRVMKDLSDLDRLGFCVGNIAPDCNVENTDWTIFTPPRELTHWTTKEDSVKSDYDAFCDEYIIKRKKEISSHEHYSFLLGYYTHLIADVEYNYFMHDDERVKNVWSRIKENEKLRKLAKGFTEDWTSVKSLISTRDRMHEIFSMELEYLYDNPTSGYLSEILTLEKFPDYIDYLPHGSIVRKIGVMGSLPVTNENLCNPIAVSRDELYSFVEKTALLAVNKIKVKKLI